MIEHKPPTTVSRRSVAKAAAWATPTVAILSVAPAIAASPVNSVIATFAPDERFEKLASGTHEGKTAITLAPGTEIEPIYIDVADQDGDKVADAVASIQGDLPEGLSLVELPDGRWAIIGTPVADHPSDVKRSELGSSIKISATSPSHPGAASPESTELVIFVGGWDINLNTAAMTFGYAGTEAYINIINEGTAPTPTGMIWAVSFNCRNVSSLATGRVVLTSALPYDVEVLPESDGNGLQGLPSTGLPTGKIVSIYLRVNKPIEPGGVLGINVATLGVTFGNRLDLCFQWINPQPSAQYEWPGKGDRFGIWTDEENAGWREKNNKIFFHSQGGDIGVDGFVAYDIGYAIRSRAEVPADEDKKLFHSPAM
ncbi:MAG: hypothetical protein Q4P06_04205 [Actinomycetaceae bacterium]|nr:hypothetical protein [Actinomycetaceae bacterium]